MPKLAIDLALGQVVCGRWQQRSYRIVKRLGAGAIGTVYLVEENGLFRALKISEQLTGIAHEVNVLKEWERKAIDVAPRLYDVDDWRHYHFYVMEYVRGEALYSFMARHSLQWDEVLWLQLFDRLAVIHRHGYVFGDMKPENIIVEQAPFRVRLIDVGGVTKVGYAIKEYTEYYDRGYWQVGERQADAHYDWFALTMMMVELYMGRQVKRQLPAAPFLVEQLRNNLHLSQYESFCATIWRGERLADDRLRPLLVKRPRQTARRKKRRWPIFFGIALAMFCVALLAIKW